MAICYTKDMVAKISVSRCGSSFNSEREMQRHRKACEACRTIWNSKRSDIQRQEGSNKSIRAAERWAELDKLAPRIIELRNQWPAPNKKEMSSLLGIPIDVLEKIVKRNGIQTKSKAIPKNIIAKAIELRALGMKAEEISNQTGIKAGTLPSIFLRNKVKLDHQQRSKNSNKKLKYSREEAERVVQLQGGVLINEPFDTRMTGSLNFTCRCGRSFTALLSDVIRGFTRSCGCIKSFDQLELAETIESWGLKTIKNDRSTIYPKEIDILIPDLKIGIEYCGLHWHGERRNGLYAKVKHLEKLDLCEKAGIRLITIFSSEWLTKRRAAEGFLKSTLGLKSEKLGARETTLRTVSESEAILFLEENHLLGSTNSGCEHIGLYLGERLVSLASFSSRNDEWTMTRYCLGDGVSVVGGFQKLLSAFRTSHPEVKSLVTFSDKRWSRGEIYLRNGFTKIRDVPPSYWYFKENGLGEIFHKSNFRKAKIVNKYGPLLPNETEWEAMVRNRYDRIWDCGLIKWELVL